MQLSDILTPERTHHGCAGTSKKRIFEFLANSLVSDHNAARTQHILDALMARERLGSTGLGQGIAIPHCRLDECETSMGALLSLDKGVEFDAPDRLPVDLMFVLLVPGAATDVHLEILAELAKRFSDEDYCERLRLATDAESLYSAAIEPV